MYVWSGFPNFGVIFPVLSKEIGMLVGHNYIKDNSTKSFLFKISDVVSFAKKFSTEEKIKAVVWDFVQVQPKNGGEFAFRVNHILIFSPDPLWFPPQLQSALQKNFLDLSLLLNHFFLHTDVQNRVLLEVDPLIPKFFRLDLN